jgi:hypothetical protein
MDDIKLSIKGENYIEHDAPKAEVKDWLNGTIESVHFPD